MSESNREPDIELKDFKLDIKEIKITVENGKLCILGNSPNITVQETKVRVEDGKACILGSSSNIEHELKKMVRRGRADQVLMFGGTMGASILLTGISLASTHVLHWWVSALFIVTGLLLMVEAMRMRNSLLEEN